MFSIKDYVNQTRDAGRALARYVSPEILKEEGRELLRNAKGKVRRVLNPDENYRLEDVVSDGSGAQEVLALAGFCSDGNFFESGPKQALEEEGYKVFNPDPPTREKIMTYYNQAKEAVLRMNNPIVIGHSLGGLITHMLSMDPEVGPYMKKAIRVGSPTENGVVLADIAKYLTDKFNFAKRIRERHFKNAKDFVTTSDVINSISKGVPYCHSYHLIGEADWIVPKSASTGNKHITYKTIPRATHLTILTKDETIQAISDICNDGSDSVVKNYSKHAIEQTSLTIYSPETGKQRISYSLRALSDDRGYALIRTVDKKSAIIDICLDKNEAIRNFKSSVRGKIASFYHDKKKAEEITRKFDPANNEYTIVINPNGVDFPDATQILIGDRMDPYHVVLVNGDLSKASKFTTDIPVSPNNFVDLALRNTRYNSLVRELQLEMKN
ncbi:hypothetical protein ACFL0W_00740 [Nanoarchaeota archaeon]